MCEEREGRLWHDLTDEFEYVVHAGRSAVFHGYHPACENAGVSDISEYPLPKGDDPGRFVVFVNGHLT